MAKNKILVLVPSYNELKTLKRICIFFKNQKIDHLIVDDFSDDGTEHWLKKNSIRFIKNKENLGYEKSIIKGIKFIIKKKIKIDFLITFDADGQHYLSDLKKFINHNIRSELLIGNRNKFNRVSEYILSKIFHIFFNINDPLSGFKRFSFNKLKKNLSKVSDNLYLVDILFIYINYKSIIEEIIINVKSRNKKDVPRVGNSLKVNLKIIKIVFSCLNQIFFYDKFKKKI